MHASKWSAHFFFRLERQNKNTTKQQVKIETQRAHTPFAFAFRDSFAYISFGICNKSTISFEISSILTITKTNGGKSYEYDGFGWRYPCGTSLFLYPPNKTSHNSWTKAYRNKHEGNRTNYNKKSIIICFSAFAIIEFTTATIAVATIVMPGISPVSHDTKRVSFEFLSMIALRYNLSISLLCKYIEAWT